MNSIRWQSRRSGEATRITYTPTTSNSRLYCKHAIWTKFRHHAMPAALGMKQKNFPDVGRRLICIEHIIYVISTCNMM